MENSAVSDTGPIIHLSEIDLTECLNIFSDVFITEEIKKELHKYKIVIPSKIDLKELNSNSKDLAKIISNQHYLDLGESSVIALALQEKTQYFFTDDLDARIVAKKYLLEAHGSLGIILRAFRERLFNKDKAIEKIKELQTKSSLFITSDLINEAIKSIERFSK